GEERTSPPPPPPPPPAAPGEPATGSTPGDPRRKHDRRRKHGRRGQRSTSSLPQGTPARSLRHAVRRAGQSAARMGRLWQTVLPAEADEPPPPPKELVRFLRDVGVALCRAGETAEQVQRIVTTLGHRYGMHPVHAFVLPTGVFVRVGDGTGAVVDFLPVPGGADLRLDQVGELYDFIHQLYDELVPPEEGQRRLRRIYALRPRFRAPLRILGYGILTVGLGMITFPNAWALIGYAVLGVFVGGLREAVEGRLRTFQLAVPVLAAICVTVLAYRYSGPLLHENPSKLLIPPLILFLPGSALTMGTMELATGSVVSGASRLVYGVNVLVLLGFGITVGAQLMHEHPIPAHAHTYEFGAWVPWAGALLLGIGFALNSSASPRNLPWLILVLLLVETVQQLGNQLGSSLGGAFLGGMTLPLFSQLVQHRKGAPPAQVTYLPAFWLLVPGALSLTGIGELFSGHSTGGLLTTVNALLTVVAVALGVLVGASFTRPASITPDDDAAAPLPLPETDEAPSPDGAPDDLDATDDSGPPAREESAKGG
ncbi:threonine/serine exporter ThrE family protein, partial [Streptomyces sp. NPDC059009]|uniref:threonine/serine ThrE exporter family protein n=1 Tax=Streptomyces sp. NPDC059009 TaxID=3346694 RepID=UPI0036B21360